MSIYDIEVPDVSGDTYKLKKYEGKLMLIVNTATKCGLARQFDELEQLYQQYKDQGLIVLGFPSNQFKQETSTGLAAQEACRLTYGVSFPMHDLVKVNGQDAHPLFKLLTEEPFKSNPDKSKFSSSNSNSFKGECLTVNFLGSNVTFDTLFPPDKTNLSKSISLE